MLPESGGDISGSIPEHSEHIYAINYTGSGFVEVLHDRRVCGTTWFTHTLIAGCFRTSRIVVLHYVRRVGSESFRDWNISTLFNWACS